VNFTETHAFGGDRNFVHSRGHAKPNIADGIKSLLCLCLQGHDANGR